MTAQPCSRLAALRRASQAMLEGRDEAMLRRQPHPELSPLLWHVGHVFFAENYWLAERIFGDRSITAPWCGLYFPEECAKHTRGARLPGPRAMREWTDQVAVVNDHYWQRAAESGHELLQHGYLQAFLRQHYAQHLETMRLAAAQLDLEAGRGTATLQSPAPARYRRVPVPAQRLRLGTPDVAAYDNEKPVHEREIAAFDIASRPVSNAEWLSFMQDGGYDRHELWDDDGWRWRCTVGIDHPQHWRAADDGWHIAGHDGREPIGDAPVHGIGWYEARAFARHAGARLPAEHEWEAAARTVPLDATGQVWEWCDSAFKPYPGFRAFPYDGYSKPWFDGHHYVTRGASVHTEADIRRPGFRNFYPPTHRHICAGLRLAW
ncbi:SUMF1/EgtB/PvdO family nonheme iron enzyme [Salinisphaera sp. LB1]|uniref:SUMF1/EgtB/PvdO family nonheme iron enzyme n=1 Tax=Salinisphaera sp. LB1 TaxID=2183911 RepID=UPI001313E7FA|nr:SUMF1/EgtB/PvdO family nonheme iron enzyme [Salinisphaera sp. LB1]